MPFGIGEYPPEYNVKVHGPYDPARFYGKKDTPLGEVKIGELKEWLNRRNYHPVSLVKGVSRGYWSWAKTWMLCKKPGVAMVAQVSLGMSVFFYLQVYNTAKYHYHVKYHW